MLRQLRPSITRRTDFVPIAALRRRLDDLARQFRFDIKDDEDDLGPIRCAYLQTEEGNAFLLRRYRSYPEDFVDLFIPFPLRERPDILMDIIGELHIGDGDVLPTEHPSEIP